MGRKGMSTVENAIPTLERCAIGHLCQYLPIPNAAGEIESNVRSNVKTVRQREQSNSGSQTTTQNYPLPLFARRPPHDCKRNQQRESRGEDLNFEKDNKRTYYHSRCYPYATFFAYSLHDKYKRCSGDCYAVQASGSCVLQPEIAISRMGDV